ncbi:hypothetical protein NL676_008380 [Syzygium grande]|nr:hypothetical protein NL676_008380 [Syzygium grande]
MSSATEPRRLRGHRATATCCIASRDRPGLVATSGEDGCVCWFDMRCKDVQLVMEIGKEAVSSLCFKPGNEDVIYVSYGKEVKCFDVRLGTSWTPLDCYDYNKEEINQIVCSSKSFLAAADDGGEIKIIDIRQQCLYKTLRNGHSSICSSVQFLPWKPWEVITGGLDSKLVMWDFSKGRPFKVVDLGSSEMKSGNSTGQCFNPAFVHSIAVPDVDMLDKLGKICVVARENTDSRERLHLDYTLGGHAAAVSCVAFSMFGERGKFIISGGNDKSIKLWNLFKYIDMDQSGSQSDLRDLLHLNIDLSRKVNWLCTTPAVTENLIVCDTTKVVKVYGVS